MSQPGSRIEVLDGFRAMAILLVVGFHYGVRWTPPWNADLYPYGDVFADSFVLRYGWAAVELFFMMSGFVILLTLERCDSVVDFFRKRIARLWPALVLCAALTSLMLLAWGPPTWRKDPISFLLSILFIDPDLVQPLVPNRDIGWIDGAYWTLAVEMRFYLLAGLAFLAGRKRFLPVWLGLQALSFVFAAPMFKHGDAFWLPRTLLMPIYLPYFTLGICFFEVFRAKAWPPLPSFGALASVVMIAINAGLWGAFAGKGAVLPVLAINGLWILLFLLFVTDSPLLRPFTFKPLARIGESSYSLFLLHEAAGIALMNALDALGLPPLLNLALVLVTMIGASMLIFHFIEEPSRNRILGWSKGLALAARQRAPWLAYGQRLTEPKAVSIG
jgi:peptidoglycan/LPS O-acetylase OafA/YrhL